MNTDRLRGKIQYKIWNKIGHISWTFERFFDQEWIIMSKKSKNVILTEKPKNFKKIRKHQKSQKTLFEPFWYHFWPFLVIWRQTKFTNVTRTPLHQKCQSQDIVQAGPPILFLVYFYDSYLQHIKSCQGKVGFENEGSYLLRKEGLCSIQKHSTLRGYKWRFMVIVAVNRLYIWMLNRQIYSDTG